MASKKMRQIRYAVVGLGDISQGAMLPGFKHARENSTLVALVSSDPEKLKVLGRKYNVKKLYSYDGFDQLLESGDIDAIYIGLPNDLHTEYARRALEAGIHVLCEKPLAPTVDECEVLIKTAKRSKAILMVAYRLHFERSNLETIEQIQSVKIGTPRFFNSIFSINIKDRNNIRLQKSHSGGDLYDIGIYCINAARFLFQSEPTEVFAFSETNPNDERFKEVNEMTSCVLRFPENRLASFTTSFGAEASGSFEIVGTKGRIRLDSAYDYSEDMIQEVVQGEKKKKKNFGRSDQFGPELIYFSDCVIKNKEPEPNGAEGLIDVKIIQALLESLEKGRPVKLDVPDKMDWPTLGQEIRRSKVSEVDKVNAQSASDPN